MTAPSHGQAHHDAALGRAATSIGPLIAQTRANPTQPSLGIIENADGHRRQFQTDHPTVHRTAINYWPPGRFPKIGDIDERKATFSMEKPKE